MVLDIGGTSIRCGTIAPSGALEQVRKAPVGDLLSTSSDRSLRALGEVCAEFCLTTAGGAIDELAVGFAGPVANSGRILSAPTLALPGDEESGPIFRDRLAARCAGARIVLINDVAAAGYSFVQRGHADFHVVTISSGIGQKLFIAGRPATGPRGWGGEVGHVSALGGAVSQPCDCGGGFHIGGVSSGRGIRRAVGEALQRAGSPDAGPDADQMALYFDEQPMSANALLSDCLAPLSYALAVLRMATGISNVFLTGGMCHQFGERIAPIVFRQIREFCWRNPMLEEPAVSVSETPNDDVLLGLAYLLRMDREGL